ncbi:hypothetical protein [Vibrio cortegadensis]|nr:hypothetical protein [Vibrio cortegadensis]
MNKNSASLITITVCLSASVDANDWLDYSSKLREKSPTEILSIASKCSASLLYLTNTENRERYGKYMIEYDNVSENLVEHELAMALHYVANINRIGGIPFVIDVETAYRSLESMNQGYSIAVQMVKYHHCKKYPIFIKNL